MIVRSAVLAFSKIHEELGFSKLIPSSSKGFDIDSIEYNASYLTVEFEYLSSNFISHGHQTQMDDKRNYVVICWEDDCGPITRLRDEHGKILYDLISIHKYVSIKNNITASQPTKNLQEPKYAKKKMSRHGKINLTRDEYFRIVGH